MCKNAVTIFYNLIFNIIDANCKKKQLYTSKYPVWFSSTLRDFVFLKKIAHKIYKSSPTQTNYNIFSNLRAKCKFHSKLNYSKYIIDTQSSLNSNPKKFWQFLKSKRSNNSLPISMTYNNQLISGGKDIVHSFSKYFSSVYDFPTPASTSRHDPTTTSPDFNLSQLNLCFLVLNTTDVLNELDTITHKSNPGPDMIPSIFFINCKFVLTVPLLHLFNLSLSSGLFPPIWKLSYITPISKSFDVTSISNYRPICLLSIIPKMFESIISKKITPLLSPSVSMYQHGFISGKTTVTNHLMFQKFILDAFTCTGISHITHL